MPTAYDIADQIAARLADLDLTALALLEERYTGIVERLDGELARLEHELVQAQAAGQPLRGAWLRDRLATVRDELRRILAVWADEAATITELAQERALQPAGTETSRLILSALGSPPLGARLPSVAVPAEALNQLIGFVGDRSPLRDFFAALHGDLVETIIQRYIDGLALGLGPRQIGSRLRTLTGEPLWRAQAMARTATINAYREAQRRIFEANSDLVRAWTWSAALDARTCAACWAMHGTVYPASERMQSHWNCRCAMLPVTKTWRELGFNVDREPVSLEPGPARFARLPAVDQRAILGPGKLALYQAGKIQLSDLVSTYEDPIWGTMRRETALRDL